MKRKKIIFIVPIFIPQQGCPHRCVFCNQTAITGYPQKWPSTSQLKLESEKFLDYNVSRQKAIMAFYGGNFLGLPREKIDQLLFLAQDFIDRGKVDGIRFSTRPDTISEKNLNLLKRFAVREIEIGVQSMDNHVLDLNQRGHRAEDTKQAVELLKKYGYKTGLQLMIGLPGQSETSAMDTARQAAALFPDFVRIYPTVVLKPSLLASWYQEGRYKPLSLDEAVLQASKIYLLFKKENIPVIRMGLQASPDLENRNIMIAGPYHPAFGHLVISKIFMDVMQIFFKENFYGSGQVEIMVHPRCISQVRGIRNKNVCKLKHDFKLDNIRVIADPGIPKHGLSINDRWVEIPCR